MAHGRPRVTQTGVGLYTIVDCMANDAEKIMDAVTDANAVVVTP